MAETDSLYVRKFVQSRHARRITHLASLAGVDPVVEAGGLVAANPAEDLIVAVEFWKRGRRNRLI